MIADATLRLALDDFVACLQSERFFEAHEALEPLWFAHRFSKHEEILLLKGFINASVSFELYKRGRTLPSEKVWKTYEKYSAHCLHVSPERQELYAEARDAILHVRATLIPRSF